MGRLHFPPLLTLIFNVVGIWGGAMVAVDWLGVYEGSFWANMQNSVDFHSDVLNGVIKSVVFALVVTDSGVPWLRLRTDFRGDQSCHHRPWCMPRWQYSASISF